MSAVTHQRFRKNPNAEIGLRKINAKRAISAGGVHLAHQRSAQHGLLVSAKVSISKRTSAFT
ncbi:MAG: hypothetical protein C0401_04625 [Anaerolinea sp.]|nr:hypothetical protein [Anaerolinea sp.]